MDLTNSTSENGDTANLETEPVATTETVPTDGEATGVAPEGEDTFTKVDPRTLPPQLRASYDNMLRDYKSKTQSISERIKAESAKAAESYRQKAESYDQIAAQEEFVRQWNEYVQKSQSPKSEPGADPKFSQLEAKFQEIDRKLQMSELSQVTDAFASATDEKGTLIHEDFDQLNTIPIGKGQDGEFSLLRACVELAQGKDPAERLENGYKSAKEAYNAIFEAGRKQGLARVQAKIMNGSQAPSKSTGEVLSTTDKKPKSAREALDMARRGQLVSRD